MHSARPLLAYHRLYFTNVNGELIAGTSQGFALGKTLGSILNHHNFGEIHNYQVFRSWVFENCNKLVCRPDFSCSTGLAL